MLCVCAECVGVVMQEDRRAEFSALAAKDSCIMLTHMTLGPGGHAYALECVLKIGRVLCLVRSSVCAGSHRHLATSCSKSFVIVSRTRGFPALNWCYTMINIHLVSDRKSWGF